MYKLFSIIFIISIYSCNSFGITNNKQNWYSDYDVKFYKIDVEVTNENQSIKGNTSIKLEILNQNIDSLKFDLSNDIVVDSVRILNRKVIFNHHGNVVSISFQNKKFQNQNVTVIIHYHGDVKTKDFYSPFVNKTDKKYKKKVTWTLSEPYNAKYWFPCKMDNTDKADSASIFITIPNYLKAASNGLLQQIVPVDENRDRYEWKTNYPIAYYLIGFAVSEYKELNFYVRLNEKDSVFVQNFIYNSPDIDPITDEFKENTKLLLKFYSEKFGNYPFANEKYGHCMAPMGGGMENQTMTTLSNLSFVLLSHEMAHQWFGDMVTCATFNDIWINEGFASYCEYLSLQKIKSEVDAQRWMKTAQTAAMRDPYGTVFVSDATENEQSRIFSLNLSYKKGAVILHVLRNEINNDLQFFEIWNQLLEKYRFKSASTANFIQIVNDVTGKNYQWFFDQWYYGKGYPLFDVSWKQIGDSVHVTIFQKSSASNVSFFKAHFDIKINFRNNNDTNIRLFQNEQLKTFHFKIDSVKSIVFDPNNWMLGKYVIDNVTDLPTYDETITILPNPFVSQLTLTFKNPATKRRSVKIVDLKGTEYLDKSIGKNQVQKIDVFDLNSGSYLLYIYEGKTTTIRKIIKESHPDNNIIK